MSVKSTEKLIELKKEYDMKFENYDDELNII